MNETLEIQNPSLIQDLILSGKDFKKEFTKVEDVPYFDCSYQRFLGKYIAEDDTVLIIYAEGIRYQEKLIHPEFIEDKLIFKLGTKKYTIEEIDYILKVENLKQYLSLIHI